MPLSNQFGNAVELHGSSLIKNMTKLLTNIPTLCVWHKVCVFARNSGEQYFFPEDWDSENLFKIMQNNSQESRNLWLPGGIQVENDMTILW